MRTSHSGNTKEDEDERLAYAAPHLEEIFDGGIRLVGDVGFDIGTHDHATGNQSVWDRMETY